MARLAPVPWVLRVALVDEFFGVQPEFVPTEDANAIFGHLLNLRGLSADENVVVTFTRRSCKKTTKTQQTPTETSQTRRQTRQDKHKETHRLELLLEPPACYSPRSPPPCRRCLALCLKRLLQTSQTQLRVSFFAEEGTSGTEMAA